MKILLTGNQGYIGCVMEEILLNEGYEVVGLDAGYFQGKSFVPIHPIVVENRKSNQLIKDMRNVELKDVEGFDAVIHLAALSNDPLGDLDPTLTKDINFHATINLAKLAKQAGVKKFLFSSSCSLYGTAEGEQLIDESGELSPITAYAKSKVWCEQGLTELADKNFAPVFMRNCTVYGVSPRMRFDLVVNNLAGWAFTTGEVVIMSDGKPWRPVVHLRDLANAFVAALKAPMKQVNTQAFNVGRNSQNFTIRQLAEQVVDSMPGSKLKCLNKITNDARSYRVNFDKVKTLKDFNPRWTVEKGVQELHDAFKQVNLTKEIFEDEYFTTLKRMKSLKERNEIGDDLIWLKS